MILIFLCAGMGKRMKSDIPKPLLPVCGTPMISHLLATITGDGLCVEKIILVINPSHRSLFQSVADKHPLSASIVLVDQHVQLGTGHAFLCAWNYLVKENIPTSVVVVANGDTPFLPCSLFHHLQKVVVSTVVAFNTHDPSGYGRILYSGQHIKIVEEKDCLEEEKRVRLVNAGVYAFVWDDVRDIPLVLSTQNMQKEMYITEVVSIIQDHKYPVHVHVVENEKYFRGANTPEELVALENMFHETL
jgi:bifunctional UDP-N-acetylglucosamine pyrophosphorylase/glucosamine-1-phosphate N-acetyltransferase